LGEKRRFDDKPLERDYAPYDTTLSNTDICLEKLANQLVKAKLNWSLCAYGVSGSGKSEFGRYVAKKIGLKVIFKRASDLLGMYVGENEKNIAAAFKEAKNEGRVLLIDEGDTFLRSRHLATRSWEASMTNEMLTQMESHTHPFILTTNLMKDLDEAALRRFTFKIKFDFVKPEQAKKLFLAFFGKEAPKAIENNHLLTPGDFANVKAKADILEITDVNELYEMLMQEVELKPQNSKPMGFL
jgi:SpoVK/Ycf46/Vps4 family AAA+-type ATPase